MTVYPSLFVCHGGGPLPLLRDEGHKMLVDALKSHRKLLENRFGLPKAIVVISAHYETNTPKVGGAERPSLLFDYYGFPEESYKFRYPVPGNAPLAAAIVNALTVGGFHAEMEPERLLDHGVFVPLMIMFPEANIPVVPLSVLRSGDPAEHIRMGKALRPLRSDAVMFIGSGSTMHHFAHFNREEAGRKFGDALTSILCKNEVATLPEDRLKAMERVKTMEGFTEAQPLREHEHLMPLLTLVGAANGNIAEEVASISFGRANVRNYLFTE
ncbi:hypothetical protein, conserved [Trypanosoma brucei gambiense DAL972]|uniref:Extradiol ring-cleavage dioxygenase class III enzyme subunit B domain-containing protein n=2 Tax=Trypanosoma brucei TaxID=5691 RepID=D0A2W7_TRYB9|nr:hypothetical protein, conserved [Trypanosoma brucei gambiense DAL972]RHW69297.1 Extradiol ring-cleavage dioxygenase [Trypanosoma brucei equiperdum]CBH15611.1 hypothetical protein, conserved [Trypanosoma brucei gambiense DAL972]|eukprot:XP_011777875.1 hypothetical protein, conserved [Trypanosoma brucei gambiense DAL972]